MDVVWNVPDLDRSNRQMLTEANYRLASRARCAAVNPPRMNA